MKRTKMRAVSAAIILGLCGTELGATEPLRIGQEELCKSYTASELTERASKMVRTMEKRLAESFKLLEQSISEANVQATNVRNQAITQMKGLVKLSEEYLLTQQQRMAEGNCARVEHEYVKISIAFAKVAELFAQVRSAGGVDGDVDELQEVVTDLKFLGALPFDVSLSTEFSEPVSAIPQAPVHASPYF